MNKKVLGIDIGANFVVCFFLDEPPTSPYPQWYRKHGKQRIHKLKFDNKGKGDKLSGVKINGAIELIQSLAPDVIVMEPTGVWYSRIWAEIAHQLDIEVKWIGHQDLHFMRGSYDFHDKDDRSRSIATQLSIEISDHTRSRAQHLVDHQILESKLHDRLELLLAHPDLSPYIPALDRCGFGAILKAAIISNIHPFDKFLLDGKRVIDRWDDDRRSHKRDRSRGAFQISLGMGKRLIESGGTTKWRYAGSGLARTLLHQWTVSNVLCKHDSENWIVTELDRKASQPAQPNNRQERPKLVSYYYHDWKGTKGSNKVKHKACIKASMTLSYRVTRILYDELMKDLT